MPPTGDLVCNPGMCPDWELNHWPFASQSSTQFTEPHQPGLTTFSLILLAYFSIFSPPQFLLLASDEIHFATKFLFFLSSALSFHLPRSALFSSFLTDILCHQHGLNLVLFFTNNFQCALCMGYTSLYFIVFLIVFRPCFFFVCFLIFFSTISRSEATFKFLILFFIQLLFLL